MTDTHWATAVDGAFVDPADWVGGVVPGMADGAVLDPAGGAFTVTVGGNIGLDLASLQTASNATFEVTNANVAVTSGTGTGANAGLIKVDDGATLLMGARIDNKGAIEIDSKGAETLFEIASAGVTLSGGGSVILSANGWNI